MVLPDPASARYRSRLPSVLTTALASPATTFSSSSPSLSLPLSLSLPPSLPPSCFPSFRLRRIVTPYNQSIPSTRPQSRLPTQTTHTGCPPPSFAFSDPHSITFAPRPPRVERVLNSRASSREFSRVYPTLQHRQPAIHFPRDCLTDAAGRQP